MNLIPVNRTHRGWADEMRVLPVDGLQLLADLEVVLLGRGRFGLEAAGVGEDGAVHRLVQEPLPVRRVERKADCRREKSNLVRVRNKSTTFN